MAKGPNTRLLLNKSLRLINKRLNYLAGIPVQGLNNKHTAEVIDYVKVLHQTTKFKEDEMLAVARKARSESDEKILARLAELEEKKGAKRGPKAKAVKAVQAANEETANQAPGSLGEEVK